MIISSVCVNDNLDLGLRCMSFIVLDLCLYMCVYVMIRSFGMKLEFPNL